MLTPVADKAETDHNGWITYADNPLSTEGVFPYLGKTIDPSGTFGLEPDKLYSVYRPGAELERAAPSFKLVPWIAGHTHLGEGHADPGKVGIGGVVGEQVYYRDGVLYGNLKVFTKQHAALLDGGVKELSLGYLVEFVAQPGVFKGQPYDFVQCNIRGNHTASVNEGRCGSLVAVQDGFVFDAKEYETMDEEMKQRLEALEAQVRELAETNAALRARLDEAEPNKGDPAETGDNDTPPTDPAAAATPAGAAVEKTDAGTLEPGQTAVITVEAVAADAMPKVLQAIGRRNKLAESLQRHVGVFDHSEMTEAQVAAYGATKLNVPAAELPGYLRGLAAAASATPVTTVGDAAQHAGTAPSFLADHV